MVYKVQGVKLKGRPKIKWKQADVLLFFIAVFVYVYDFATTDCFNLAFVLQDFNKRKRKDPRSLQLSNKH